MKKLDCALLPPCRKTLQMKIRRAQYVAMLWNNASTAAPMTGHSPCDYGWSLDDKGRLLPKWFEGSEIPDNLLKRSTEEDMSSGDEERLPDSEEELSDSETDAWSEDED